MFRQNQNPGVLGTLWKVTGAKMNTQEIEDYGVAKLG